MTVYAQQVRAVAVDKLRSRLPASLPEATVASLVAWLCEVHTVETVDHDSGLAGIRCDVDSDDDTVMASGNGNAINNTTHSLGKILSTTPSLLHYVSFPIGYSGPPLQHSKDLASGLVVTIVEAMQQSARTGDDSEHTALFAKFVHTQQMRQFVDDFVGAHGTIAMPLVNVTACLTCTDNMNTARHYPAVSTSLLVGRSDLATLSVTLVAPVHKSASTVIKRLGATSSTSSTINDSCSTRIGRLKVAYDRRPPQRPGDIAASGQQLPPTARRRRKRPRHNLISKHNQQRQQPTSAPPDHKVGRRREQRRRRPEDVGSTAPVGKCPFDVLTVWRERRTRATNAARALFVDRLHGQRSQLVVEAQPPRRPDTGSYTDLLAW